MFFGFWCIPQKNILYPEKSFCIPKQVFASQKKFYVSPKKFYVSPKNFLRPKKSFTFAERCIPKKNILYPKKDGPRTYEAFHSSCVAAISHELALLRFQSGPMAAVPSHCPVRIVSNFMCPSRRLHALEYRVETVPCFTRINPRRILAIFGPLPPSPLTFHNGRRDRKNCREWRTKENKENNA